ncbi:MAG: hypothetical protein JW854_16485 [Actinobacteria bacterium]|nr:hypothetical protein [Actinomycetota bacterium]
MAEKSEKQMAKMVDAVQPHCDEAIVAAMTCSHAGSMGSLLASKLAGGIGGMARTSGLPNPVFIAVGTDTIYAFDYRPRGFKFKIKKEVARWPRAEMNIEVEETGKMCYFTMTTSGGESYAMEVPTVMSGKDLVALFIAALRG